MSDTQLLQDKVAVVTGVSSGLGRAIVRSFVDEGAKVVGCARRATEGETLAEELGAANGSFEFVQADVADLQACRAVIDTAVERHGRIDILVNNAAIRTTPPAIPFHELDEDNWDRVLDVNLKAATFAMKFAIEHMRAQGGGVVLNVGSIASVTAHVGMAAYTASKAALAQLSRSTAVEYVDDGIRVNAILLGPTATGQVERTVATVRAASGLDANGGGFGKYQMDPAKVADAVAVLCSDRAALITGTTIPVDSAASAGSFAWEFMKSLATGNAKPA